MIQPELLRHVNQEIENLWLSRLRPDDILPVICECSDARCTAVVDVELRVFQDAVERSCFLVAPGHAIAGCRRILAGNGWELLTRE